MKYLLLALAIVLLLAQLVSGSWYVKKCANKIGNCRSKCRTGEIQIVPPTGMCSKEKTCCVLNGKELNPLLCGGDGGGSGGTVTVTVTSGPSGGGSTPSGGGSSKTTGASKTGTQSTPAGANSAPASTTAKAPTTNAP